MFLSSPSTFPVRGFSARSPLIFVQLCLLSVLEIPLYAVFFSTFPNVCSEVSFSSVKVVHAFHALDDFLVCSTCLAFSVLPRGFTALLDGSRGIYRRFCFSHGLRHYTSYPLYPVVRIFGTCFAISRPGYCITTFFTLRSGAGLGKKKTSWFTSASSLFLTKHGFTNGISGRPQKKRGRDLADEELRGSHVLITIPFHATS